MDDRQLLTAAAQALEGRDWAWWTSNSYRRLTFKDGPNTRDGGALSGTVHPHDKWPDVSMAPGVQEFIERASPKAILGMVARIALLEAALRPFAEEFKHWDGVGCWDSMSLDHMANEGRSVLTVTYADLRRAATAMGDVQCAT